MRCPKCGTFLRGFPESCPVCTAKIQLKCARCGTMNKGGAKFCKDCGWPLVGKFSKSTDSLCGRCQSPVERGASNCPSCGAPIDWSQERFE